MTSFEETLWRHLVEEHGADTVDFPSPQPRRRRLAPAVAGASTVALAVLASVLLLAATGATSPAYALTSNGNGSYTITLHDLTRGIPALNVRLRTLGVRATVVPITPGCTTRTFAVVGHAPGSMDQNLTLENADIPTGQRAYIAAEQTAEGKVLLAEGTTSTAIPSCFAATAVSGFPGR
jgi:hypothetical protein